MAKAQVQTDVLCVGHASYDLIFPVPRHPLEDEKCTSSGFIGVGGGPAANASVAVARLGGTAAFAGYLGRDYYGDLHFEELRSEGVATDLVVRGPHPTPVSAILVKPDGKRTVINHRAATPRLEPFQLDFSRVHPRAVLFDGHEPLVSVPFAETARSRNIVTVLDAGSVHKGTIELAPRCDYLVGSEAFARGFCAGQNPPGPGDDFDAVAAVRRLAREVPFAVITMGAKGLVWSAAGEWGSLPAPAVRAVDTTGAGDIFHAAFALRIAIGDDLVSALRYACAAAALGCTRLGARPGIPTRNEVDTFLRDHRDA